MMRSESDRGVGHVHCSERAGPFSVQPVTRRIDRLQRTFAFFLASSASAAVIARLATVPETSAEAAVPTQLFIDFLQSLRPLRQLTFRMDVPWSSSMRCFPL